MCRTKTKYMRIDGSVKTSDRQALVNDFQNNRDLRAAVLSIKAAGTGLTLTVRPLFPEPRLRAWLLKRLRQHFQQAGLYSHGT